MYPRTTALVRWLETLADGVLELTPFPHSSSFSAEPTSTSTSSNSSTKDEPRPQGLISIHKLPVFHERGGGGGIGGAAGVVGGGEDLAFTVSRKRFEIRLFCLPPEGGDVDAQKGEKGEAKAMDF